MARHLARVGRVLPLAIVLAWAMPVTGQQGAKDATGKIVEWRYYHGDQKATRYSPLDQINKDNVADLELAWRFPLNSFGPRPEYKNETTPIMVKGVLYFTAGFTRNVVAANAATGEMLWMWRMDEGVRGEKAPRGNSGRGVAYWTDGRGDERIYTVTPGYHLVALNAKTGLPVPGFGRNGLVDLMQGVRGTADPVGAIGNSSPPLIANDVLVVPPALESGFRPRSKTNIPADIRGFDVRTGRTVWTFKTIPSKGENGYETWEGSSAEYTGNAGVWAPMSVDEELGYLYLPTEAATGDYYGGLRLGKNLYSTSLVCLDVKTGKIVWHFQTVHHDIFDYDNPTAPILLDINVGGTPIKAVVQLTKQAWAYVFDRVTGKPVWPIEERPVPQSDVPGEKAWPTQPFVTKPAAFDVQGVATENLIDFTPELRNQALETVKQYRLGPLFSPPSLVNAPDGTKGTISLPGANGGALWEAGAADPETGFVYVGSSTRPTLLALATDPKSDVGYSAPGYPQAPGPLGLPLVKPPYGRITAIDMNTGEHAWMVPSGDTPPVVRNHPALKGVKLPRTGSLSRAGILVTKTLVFAGEGWGGLPKFRAYDKQTGEIVWETQIPGAQCGLPMAYLIDGKQYIAFTVGNPDTDLPAQLVAFRLADK